MKKIGLLCLALVLALGSLGFAYAKWSDTVTISKTITTDDVRVSWGTWTPWDDCLDASNDYNLDLDKLYPPEGTDPVITWVRVDKDVGCTSVTMDGDSLVVTVTCAYPLYYGDIEVEFCNLGSVPVKLQSITPEAIGGWSIASKPWFTGEGSDICDGAIWVNATDGVGTQIDPGYDQCKAASVKWVVQQCASQSTTYQFRITWTVVNWNEY